MLKRILDWFLGQRFEYGFCKGELARRNKKTGAVEFILWKSGERGHTEDYWHPFDSYWWSMFKTEQPEGGA